MAQTDSVLIDTELLNKTLLLEYQQRFQEAERQRANDSIQRAELELQLNKLRTVDNAQKDELLKQLQDIDTKEQLRVALEKQRIETLKKTAHGYPVLGILNDTLFNIYSKLGATTAKERALQATRNIEKLYNDDFLKVDSIMFSKEGHYMDIFYGDMIILSISETDALWQSSTQTELAQVYLNAIKEELIHAKKENKVWRILMRIGLLILVMALMTCLFWLVGKGIAKMLAFFELKKDKWLKALTYRDYTFLSAEQEYRFILFMIKPIRWISYLLILYFTLPLIFSIFPFTRSWADDLFRLIWIPFRAIFMNIWQYLPNLLTIVVICFVMRYALRLVRYIFKEIEQKRLQIKGFYSDWAMPTYTIIRFLLLAFMFVVIFPYLPGAESEIFKGVSVFLGLLVSLGSSTAIANMVAGLVITYMRPFKIGDRIKIGDTFGDVAEKTLLVTRIKTPKNEIITVPNSTVLSSNTINYSSEIHQQGLILYSTVTIGYDVPWQDMHAALIEAAMRTELVEKEPNPFVLQTSLDDFYVSYQINVYTKHVIKQALIYSKLHQNIQDVCNERSIEIMSPHYRSQRDGNNTTIPANYLDKNYKAPPFNVRMDTHEK